MYLGVCMCVCDTVMFLQFQVIQSNMMRGGMSTEKIEPRYARLDFVSVFIAVLDSDWSEGFDVVSIATPDTQGRV